jgi:hypothetical protein
MNEFYLFAAAFITVFALGFQQQNVAGRHYLAAVFTSMAIGSAQLFLWRLAPTATVSEIMATLAGGPVGIIAAMYVHPRIARRWKR